MLEKARNGVPYRRICQTIESATPVTFGDAVFTKHCIDMCELRASATGTALLKIVDMRYPYKFMVIDREVVVLQLHEIKEVEGSTQRTIWCELVVKDTTGDLVGVFLDMWDRLSDSETARTVNANDIAR